MAEYILTSPLMTGYLKFGYDQEGRLTKFENSAILDFKQQQYLYDPNNFPLQMHKMNALAGKNGKIEEVQEVNFAKFWEEYDYKKGKLKAELEWKKLNPGEQARAINRIKPFKYYCHTKNIEMVYPERYLKHKRFDDE